MICWKSFPCGACGLSDSRVSLLKNTRLEWFWHQDCVLVLHECKQSFHFDPHNSPFWVCPNFSVPLLGLLSTWHVCQNMISFVSDGRMTTCHLWVSDWCDDAASRFWLSISVGINCRACCSIPRDIRTQDIEFPGCCDCACTSITKVPADLNTFMSSHCSDFDMISDNCL